MKESETRKVIINNLGYKKVFFYRNNSAHS